MARNQDAIAAFPSAVDAWYSVHGRSFSWRRGELQPWQILVTECLLQQTQSPRVDAFLGLFFREIRSLDDLADRAEEGLAALLRPLGLHQKRARTLRALALALRAVGRIPTTREELLALPGVGPYVAHAFLCATRGERVAMLDVNFVRILERRFAQRVLADERDDPVLAALATALIARAPDPRRFNWAMLDLGALVCTARAPRCIACPVARGCPSAAHARS
jgi:A/G-specific adenine glycosylase